MSVALESNRRIDIEASGLARGGVACVPATAVFDSLDEVRELNAAVQGEVCSSSSTSSIGRNSDLSRRSGSDGEDGEENEVQSKYKGTLDSMEALEEVLPIRRGISNFYQGKSKSFTSLAEAASKSVKDIAKAESAYTRRRRNLLSFNHIWDNKNRNFSHRNGGGGISKRPITTSRSSVVLAMALSSSESISNTSDDSNSSSYSRSPPRLPPLHPLTRASYNNLAASASPLSSPQQKFSSRSYSSVDLQQSATLLTNTNSYCSSASDERR